MIGFQKKGMEMVLIEWVLQFIKSSRGINKMRRRMWHSVEEKRGGRKKINGERW